MCFGMEINILGIERKFTSKNASLPYRGSASFSILENWGSILLKIPLNAVGS